MDSTALLDSALFQLTPTRTRFDLVLFRGNKNEKLASGLFEPFISHLKFARDQSSRGGYSISLRPPTSHSHWFTKSTFERFVRFVNTPAILERFVSLEKEISQIEHSIHANEIANATGPDELQDGGKNSNLRKSNEESNEGAEQENSKIQLQRLLETRRTMLRREQAMAYARGVAAGFEMDGMDDLISFADAFGASRLREACNNYKDLWKKKHGDGLWMAELAAVKACPPPDMSLLGSSGIILSNEVAPLSVNGTDTTTSNAGSDTKDDKSGNSDQIPSAIPAFQAPMAWPSHIPQYFYPFQQPPPYQGYPYPPMQPHQTTGSMTWPKKGKSYKKNGSEDFEGDESSESSESDSVSDDSASSLEDQGKRRSRTNKEYRKSAKNRKKASKTVIIRNINYITPDGRHEEMEDNELTTNSLFIKDTVDAAVGPLGKEKKAATRQGSGDDIIEGTPQEKRNENWDAFQNILMNHDEKSINGSVNLRSMDVGEEHFTLRSSIFGAKSEDVQVKDKVLVDSSMVTQRSVENGGGVAFEHFVCEEGTRRLPRTMDSADEFMLLTKRSEMLGNGSKEMNYASGAEKSVMKSGNGEDWFVADTAGKMQAYEGTTFDGSCILTSEGPCNARGEQTRKQELVDDSFMVQSSLAGDDLYDSRWRPDLSIAEDLALASNTENGHADKQKEKRGMVDPCEPNDLFMILDRSHEAVDDSLAIDHGMDLSVVEANARLSSIGISQEEDKSGEKKNNNNNAKNTDARAKSRITSKALAKSRAETMSKTAKKPSVASRTMAQKSKFEKEEEMRKRIEDHLKERQKRIAERSAMAGSRRASLNSSTSKASSATIARAPVRARAT